MPDKPIFEVHKTSENIVVKFSSTLELIDDTADEVKVFMEEAGLRKHSFGIRIVMREGLTNAVRHGNKNNPEKIVMFEMSIEDRLLTMVIKDEGDGFDWGSVKDNCCPSDNEVLPLDHGRGFPIMEEYFDKYEYNEKGNVLILKKDIST